MALKGLLQSKTLLYVLLFLAITNVVGYLSMEDYQSVVLFIAVGYLSTFFSKNMIVNLLAPIVVTNVLFTRGRIMEGMKGKKGEDSNEEKDGETKVAKKPTKKVVKKAPAKAKKPTKGGAQGFSTNNARKLTPAAASESMEDEEVGKHIDYSATLEQAYDNLENILGDGGMESLSKDTKDLIKQQQSLMKTMQSMAPILKNANGILSKLDMSQMNGAMGSISSLMSKFGGSPVTNTN